MRLVVWLVLVAGLLTTSGAFAVWDSEPNKLGVYFDPEASSPIWEGIVDSTFTAYIVVTNFTEAQVYGLECGYTIESEMGDLSSLQRIREVFPPGALSVEDSSNPYDGGYVIGFAVPMPAVVAMPIVEWEFRLLSPGVIIGFDLGPAPVQSIPDGQPAVEIGGTIIPLAVSVYNFQDHFHNYGVHSAVLVSLPVANSVRSFGTVKALFR